MDKRIIVCRDCSSSVGETKRNMFKKHFTMFTEKLTKTLKDYDKLNYTSIGFTTTEQFNMKGVFRAILSSFDIVDLGGTYMTSGLNVVNDLIENLNTDEEIYVLFYTDGDNWGEDNDDTIALIKEIVDYNDTYFYYVECKTSRYLSSIGNRVVDEIKHINVHSHFIHTDSEIEENVKMLFDKPKTYMTLEEAVQTGKKIKHKDSTIWHNVPQNALTDAVGRTGKDMFELLKVKEFEVNEG